MVCFLVARSAESSKVRVRIVFGNSIRDNMMDIKSAAIGFGRLIAMLTDFVALSDLFCLLGPERKPLNFVRKIARIITQIVINVFASVPFHFADSRTESATMLLAGLSAPLAIRKRLASRINSANPRAVFRSVHPIGRFEMLLALKTDMRSWLCLSQAVTLMRTVLTLLVPIAETASQWLGKCLITMETFLSEFDHIRKDTGKRIALQGNT